MGTTIKSQLSKKNKHWIEKHRFYELKHFCLQYPIWKKAYLALDGYYASPLITNIQGNSVNKPVEKCAEAKIWYYDRMRMVERVALDTDEELHIYLLTGIVEGLSYDILKARLNIPCCREVYYDLYRRFFWLLNKARQ